MRPMIALATLALGCGGGDGYDDVAGDGCTGKLPDGRRFVLQDGEDFCQDGVSYACDDGDVLETPDASCGGGDSDADTDSDSDADTDSDSDADVPPGCERSALESDCSGEPGVGETWDVEVAGETRTYNVYVPTNAACGTPVGILFFFHGLGGNENNFNSFEPLAEEAGVVFVQPRGSAQSWAGGALGWVPDGFDDNVDFVRAIRDSVEAIYDVDPYRVWIAGFSQGAFMSAALASPDAMGDEVTGVGIFGGGEEGNTCPGSGCYARLACKVPFFMRTGDSDSHLAFTQDLYDGLVAASWPEGQLDFETFPGGHTIRPQDVEQMMAWLDGAYPAL